MKSKTGRKMFHALSDLEAQIPRGTPIRRPKITAEKTRDRVSMVSDQYPM